MGRSAVWLLAALLLEALISAEAKNSPQYLEVGGKLVLSPEPVSDPITSITWKVNGSIVGEWVTERLPLEFSPAFRGRANVDKTTGVLEINNLMTNDSRVYTVEINDKIQSGSHDVRVITQVPEPQAVLGPLTCSQSSESCNLRCEGDVTEAGPVTYYFKKGDGDWEKGEQSITIMNDENTQAVPTFSCRMKNPLGQKDSKPVKNPFHVGSNAGNTAGIVFGVLFLIAVVAAGVVLYLKKWKSCGKTPETPAASTEENGGKPEGVLLMQAQNGDKQEEESANDLQPQNGDEAKEEPANIINPDPKEDV